MKTFRIIPLLLSIIITALFCSVAVSQTDTGASFRTVSLWTYNKYFEPYYGADNSVDFMNQSILRITAQGSPGKRLNYEIHAVQDSLFSTAPGGISAAGGGSALADYRAFDASLDWLRRGDTSARLWFDRFNIRCSFDRADLTIGRQAVTFGKAYFWNPLDVFMPFDPSQFDRDYKSGVDAARLDFYLDDFSGITLVAAPGRMKNPWLSQPQRSFDADKDASALIARYYTSRGGWDYSLQGGLLYGGTQAGFGAVGEIDDYQVRIEAAYFSATEDMSLLPLRDFNILEDWPTAVLGIGRYYPCSLDVEVEYLYNGAGEPGDLDSAVYRKNYGAALHMGRHIIGANAAYEFRPLVNGSLAAMVSLSDSSSQLQPGLNFSLSNNSELLVGAIFSFGERPKGTSVYSPGIRSEFGINPHVLYTEYKVYF